MQDRVLHNEDRTNNQIELLQSLSATVLRNFGRNFCCYSFVEMVGSACMSGTILHDLARIGWPDWKCLGWLGQLHCFSPPSLREWTWRAGSYRILGSRRRVGSHYCISHYHVSRELDSVAWLDALHCSPLQVVCVWFVLCCRCRGLCCLLPLYVVVMILLVHAMIWYHKCVCLHS